MHSRRKNLVRGRSRGAGRGPAGDHKHSTAHQLEDEIDKLRHERDEQAALVAQMREQVADYDALIERLIEAFAKLKASHELLQRGGE